MNVTKLLMGVGLGVGAYAGINYIRKMNSTNQNLEIIPTAQIHKVNLLGLFIRMDIRFKNPDGGTFKIKYPFVKIQFEGETIGTSQAIDKDISIPPYGEAVVNGIMIEIPITNILTTGYKIYKNIINNKSVKMTALTHTTLKVGFQTVPYDVKNEITLKK
ncbi:MAG: hypothetical protein JNM95_12130 [Chitinophagaceae bacterium]|nr:hypothetical protein [Chitinophagaceae bacterium]